MFWIVNTFLALFHLNLTTNLHMDSDMCKGTVVMRECSGVLGKVVRSMCGEIFRGKFVGKSMQP